MPETTQLHVKQPADLMEKVKEFRLKQRWNLQVAVEELLKAGLKAFESAEQADYTTSPSMAGR